MSVLVPPAVIGIAGGGQLGRMLAQTAQRHGYRVAVLTGGDQRTPAGVVADIEIAAPFDDEAAVQRLVDCADVITWELEDVDLGLADTAATAGVPVRPRHQVVAIAADRATEKKAPHRRRRAGGAVSRGGRPRRAGRGGLSPRWAGDRQGGPRRL